VITVTSTAQHPQSEIELGRRRPGGRGPQG
jgi:hypothetical protein